jgi:hypothetical protein
MPARPVPGEEKNKTKKTCIYGEEKQKKQKLKKIAYQKEKQKTNEYQKKIIINSTYGQCGANRLR